MNWNKNTTDCRNIILLLAISVFVFSIVQQSVVANHGKEVLIKLSDAQFFLQLGKNLQQVKVTTIYSAIDPAIVGKQISGTMKIYTSNGSLLKTTSIPNGFKVEKSGFQQFVTSLPNSATQSITATVLFTDLNKTAPFSNSITTNMSLNKTQ